MADKRKKIEDVEEPEATDVAAAGADPGGTAEAGEQVVDAGVLPPLEAAAPAPPDELAQLTDKYLRLAAEFDNFRKRTGRERLELRTRAQADLIAQLIDALDDLGRVAHLDPATAKAVDVIAGVELAERKMLKQLEAAGLERISAVDVPFDPNQHEAVAQAPAATPDQDHTVAAVFQVGYRFAGQLLRAARVQVRLWLGEPGGE
ncbi:MAG TPA: nucleotide exchange factor GrpE [Gemmatimonadales bacterium]|nr:nucleotide exchange factor GrpE [Gemmatimonadales bacterium]